MELKERKKRYKIVRELHIEGKTFRFIGERLGLTRSRVQQIYKGGRPQAYSGRELSPFWKGKPKWLRKGRERVRELVRARDNYTCQSCKKVWVKGSRRFDVHHLKGLCGKKSRGYDRVSEMGGLITLCHKCHYDRHDFSQNSKRAKMARA